MVLKSKTSQTEIYLGHFQEGENGLKFDFTLKLEEELCCYYNTVSSESFAVLC